MPAKSKKSQFQVEEWSLDRVRETLAAYNPRIISEKDLNDLAAGIETFGMLLPVVINSRTNRMVGGHQRFKAAEKVGLETIPVTLVDVDEAKEKALNLALNKIEGKWDYQLLEKALTEVAEADLLSLSGFSEADLVEILSGQDEEFSETFEEFTQRFANRKTMDTVMFRSAMATFTCTKSAYEALVQRLYAKVGVDDVAATIAFFQMIGLGDS